MREFTLVPSPHSVGEHTVLVSQCVLRRHYGGEGASECSFRTDSEAGSFSMIFLACMLGPKTPVFQVEFHFISFADRKCRNLGRS